MKFDSFVFAVFLAGVLPLYWAIPSRRVQNAFVLAASYLFYGWWDGRFLALLAFSTAVDYHLARLIEAADDPRRARVLVTASVVVNLGVLGAFKYFDFFATSAADLLRGLGLQANPWTLRLVLPVGISFYTFQSMAYTIDVYRGRLRASRSLVAFAAYVAFFPQLVAGPIERAQALLPQFALPRVLTRQAWRTGLTLVVYGLVKKVAIADNMAVLADHTFGLPDHRLTGPLVLLGTAAFALQIYADFSGYSDVARGIARLFGFELMANFKRPYVSATPSEFWRRWHVSLSSWLRDYLYVPLGGNRGGGPRTYRNLMLTMLLGGLWHGAAWNFVLWGLFHGGLLCLYRAAGVDEGLERLGRGARLAVATPVFFALTLYGWLLFRAESLSQVAAMTGALASSWAEWGIVPAGLLVVLYYALPVIAHHGLARARDDEKWAPAGTAAWTLTLVAVSAYGILHGRASAQAFIYFQF
ncbi:MBOAT family protein [Myxococcota bacterium]|nr:MBOAT family protein [Myxococcota bacterium]